MLFIYLLVWSNTISANDLSSEETLQKYINYISGCLIPYFLLTTEVVLADEMFTYSTSLAVDLKDPYKEQEKDCKHLFLLKYVGNVSERLYSIHNSLRFLFYSVHISILSYFVVLFIMILDNWYSMWAYIIRIYRTTNSEANVQLCMYIYYGGMTVVDG